MYIYTHTHIHTYIHRFLCTSLFLGQKKPFGRALLKGF